MPENIKNTIRERNRQSTKFKRTRQEDLRILQELNQEINALKNYWHQQIKKKQKLTTDTFGG